MKGRHQLERVEQGSSSEGKASIREVRTGEDK